MLPHIPTTATAIIISLSYYSLSMFYPDVGVATDEPLPTRFFLFPPHRVVEVEVVVERIWCFQGAHLSHDDIPTAAPNPPPPIKQNKTEEEKNREIKKYIYFALKKEENRYSEANEK